MQLFPRLPILIDVDFGDLRPVDTRQRSRYQLERAGVHALILSKKYIERYRRVITRQIGRLDDSTVRGFRRGQLAVVRRRGREHGGRKGRDRADGREGRQRVPRGRAGARHGRAGARVARAEARVAVRPLRVGRRAERRYHAQRPTDRPVRSAARRVRAQIRPGNDTSFKQTPLFCKKKKTIHEITLTRPAAATGWPFYWPSTRRQLSDSTSSPFAGSAGCAGPRWPPVAPSVAPIRPRTATRASSRTGPREAPRSPT